MNFAIEKHEYHPHQIKEALTKNRTYHLMRWKEKYVIENTTLEYAIEVFGRFGKGYRLTNIDNGEIIKQNELIYPR